MADPTGTAAVEYPSSDGQPMAETHIHVQAIMLLHQALEDFFAGRPDVLVSSDTFWYWEEGNPDARISPDVMATLGVPPDRDVRTRRSFYSWKENGTRPSVVFEMASKGTWREDIGEKFERYQELGVPEYFLFDPEGLYLDAQLIGYRLRGGQYRRLRPANGDLASRLGFRVRAEGTELRLVYERTGTPILTRAERAARAEAAADAEKRRADAAAQRADAVERIAELERQRADAERQRADALQAELARLRDEMRRAGGGGP